MEAANNDPKAGLKGAEANPNASGNGNGRDLNGNGNGRNGNGKKRRKFLKLIAALGGAAIIAKIWPQLAEAQTQSHPPSQINQSGATTGQFLQWSGSAWAPIALRSLLGADSNTVTVTGITATQVKDIDFIKNTSTLSVATLTIAARIKSSNALYTTTLRVRADGAGTDSLTLTTTSTSLTVVTGTISASGYAAGRHTLEFFMDSSNASGVATMDMTEVWGE